ncbi:MAG TPA: glycosyl hydrolase, partial [Chloroflexota bacterium]|nr:glycosyl hydrolase [Chloroflexota bacterium]
TACLSPNGLNRYDEQAPVTRLLVGTAHGVSVLSRAGAGLPWRVESTQLEDQHISSLLVEPAHGGVFAGVHHGGLFYSQDRGETWQQRDRGIDVHHVFSLGCTLDGRQPVLYAGTEPAHLFRSWDCGLTWRELPALRDVPNTDKWSFPAPPHEGHVKTIVVDKRDARVIYAGVEQGAVLRSRDGGRSWSEVATYYKEGDPVYKDTHQVLLRPSNQDEIYLTGGMGVYRSPDAGKTWEHLTDHSFRISYPDQLQFSPLDDRTVFLAGAASSPGAWRHNHMADSTIMRSRDGGQKWEPAGTGLPSPMRANIEALGCVGWPGGYALFAGNTDGDVFTSEDEGQTWTLAASGLAPISKGGHFQPLQAAAA